MRDEQGKFVKGHAPTAFKQPDKWVTRTCPCGTEFTGLIVRGHKTCSKECRYLYRKPHAGHSEETKRKIGLSNKKFYKANPHKIPTWNGGVSFKKYTWEFKKTIRNEIRARDKYACRECPATEGSLGYKFSCHHIDYDTLNNSLENLILLCRSCHAKTNVRREQWKEYFQGKAYGKA